MCALLSPVTALLVASLRLSYKETRKTNAELFSVLSLFSFVCCLVLHFPWVEFLSRCFGVLHLHSCSRLSLFTGCGLCRCLLGNPTFVSVLVLLEPLRGRRGVEGDE